MTVVRLCRSRYSPTDATGAKLHGGRWNSPGTAILYASSTLALACLEVLVHFRDVGLMPRDYVSCEVDVPDEMIAPWSETAVRSLALIESQVLSREFGDAWADNSAETRARRLLADLTRELHGTTAAPPFLLAAIALSGESPAGHHTSDGMLLPVQAVPSVVIPRELNYLINPAHPQFEKLTWRTPEPFQFDLRLIPSPSE